MKYYATIFIFVIFLQACNDKIVSNANPDNGNEHPFILPEEGKGKISTYSDLYDILRSLKNEITKEKEIDNFVYQASYQPHLALTLMNSDSVKQDDRINQKFIEKTLEYNKLHYISFSIENKEFKSELLRYNATSPEEYSERVSYYSFHIKQDVYLIENSQDTLKNAMVVFERTFDASPKLKLTFVFERTKTTPVSELTFEYNDIIFNNGKIKFNYDYDKFSHLNAPGIKKLTL